MCELLLRGPQTPGELRTRAPSMADFPDPGVIESVLAASQAVPAAPSSCGWRASPTGAIRAGHSCSKNFRPPPSWRAPMSLRLAVRMTRQLRAHRAMHSWSRA